MVSGCMIVLSLLQKTFLNCNCLICKVVLSLTFKNCCYKCIFRHHKRRRSFNVNVIHWFKKQYIFSLSFYIKGDHTFNFKILNSSINKIKNELKLKIYIIIQVVIFYKLQMHIICYLYFYFAISSRVLQFAA